MSYSWTRNTTPNAVPVRTACDREPIHSPGTVQDVGFMLIVAPVTQKIVGLSGNCHSIFQQRNGRLVGQALQDLFNENEYRWICLRCEKEASNINFDYIPTTLGSRQFHLAAHRNGYWFIEGITAPKNTQVNRVDYTRELSQTITEAAQTADLESLCQLVANRIQTISGYNRAMVYRFDELWHGQVLVEATDSETRTEYLGLHFPSTDIPENARKLYHINAVRNIIDTTTENIGLVPNAVSEAPFDLSYAHLRSVSPAHIEYLNNMGVRSSMSISIIVDDKLWGLIACHNINEAKHSSLDERQICEAIAKILANNILRIASANYNRKTRQTYEYVKNINNCMRAGGSLFTTLCEMSDEMQSLFAADGVEIQHEGKHFRSSQLHLDERTHSYIRNNTKNGIFIHSNLSDALSHHPDGLSIDTREGLPSDTDDKPAGVIFIDLSNDASHYLCLMRRAIQRSIVWAGKPQRIESSQNALLPRRSFEAWQQHIKDEAPTFGEIDSQAAKMIRHAIIEYYNEEEKRRTRRLIERQAKFDALTNLPNRSYFNAALESNLELQKHSTHNFALLFIDLDNFKHINDTLGHSVGDQILKEASRRIRECSAHYDFVARLSGDEFTVIVRDHTSLSRLDFLCQNIIDSISLPFVINDGRLHIGCSIGVTQSPEQGTRIEDLTRNADLALQKAKELGKSRFEFFTPQILETLRRRTQLEKELRDAIDNKEFEYYFQPIINTTSQTLIGTEALMRWNHPSRGILNPDVFRGLAEEMGLINELDSMLILSLKHHQQELLKSHPNAYISCNLSARAFSTHRIIELLAQLREAGIALDHLAFEITENVLIECKETAKSIIEQLRSHHIRVLIDDFGTGYSSLSYLNDLPVSGLKIDQSFVTSLDNVKTEKLVRTIVSIAEQLDLSIVAEGIESTTQQEILHSMDCNIHQGHFYAEPMAWGEFYEFSLRHTEFESQDA